MRVVFVGQDRVVWRLLVLYVLTLGISRRIWLYRVTKEVDGHQALGLNHRVTAALLCLPIGGPSFVTAKTAGRTRVMLTGSGIPHGRAGLLWAATLVPILGNLFFIAWVQGRLNRFWAQERATPGHGIDIDIDLSADPSFLVELGQALKQSYEAGSRFDQGKDRRRARSAARRAWWAEVQAERTRVRKAGGSTPLLPFLRPKTPPRRILHVACGRCETRFDVVQDPFVETPVVCPTCALTEVIPSLHSDPLAPPDRAQVAAVRATCPNCQLAFQAVRNLHGPTPLVCPRCGTQEELAAPAQSPPKRATAKARAR